MTETIVADQKQEKIWKRKNNTETKVLMLFVTFVLGHFGVHRFLCNKFGTGILYLFTFGLFGVGTLVDIILQAVDCWDYGPFEIKLSGSTPNGY